MLLNVGAPENAVDVSAESLKERVEKAVLLEF
jgi:hypothetical protein